MDSNDLKLQARLHEIVKNRYEYILKSREYDDKTLDTITFPPTPPNEEIEETKNKIDLECPSVFKNIPIFRAADKFNPSTAYQEELDKLKDVFENQSRHVIPDNVKLFENPRDKNKLTKMSTEELADATHFLEMSRGDPPCIFDPHRLPPPLNSKTKNTDDCVDLKFVQTKLLHLENLLLTYIDIRDNYIPKSKCGKFNSSHKNYVLLHHLTGSLLKHSYSGSYSFCEMLEKDYGKQDYNVHTFGSYRSQKIFWENKIHRKNVHMCSKLTYPRDFIMFLESINIDELIKGVDVKIQSIFHKIPVLIAKIVNDLCHEADPGIEPTDDIDYLTSQLKVIDKFKILLNNDGLLHKELVSYNLKPIFSKFSADSHMQTCTENKNIHNAGSATCNSGFLGKYAGFNNLLNTNEYRSVPDRIAGGIFKNKKEIVEVNKAQILRDLYCDNSICPLGENVALPRIYQELDVGNQDQIYDKIKDYTTDMIDVACRCIYEYIDEGFRSQKNSYYENDSFASFSELLTFT